MEKGYHILNANDIVQLAHQAGLRLVRFQYCDNGGIIRCKATHTGKLATRIHEGIGHCRAMAAWSSTETLPSLENMGPVGEFRLVPDPETFTILPYVPRTGAVICDWLELDGRPWEADPRYFLKRMIALAAQSEVRVEAAVEHEFYLAREEMGHYIPADCSLCYSPQGLDEQAQVIDALLDALEAQGLSIEQVHTELGPGQLELSLTHTDILRAADTICRVRETVRGVARLHNLVASFAPKPFIDQPGGNGAHIHLSLWDSAKSKPTRRNLFYDPHQHGCLSQTGRYFIGGVLRHIRGLVALTCASVNSYNRLLPHHWSSAYGAWGFDNREAAVRVPSVFWGREEKSINVELKCADHSGNPYLALGSFLAAGLDGLRNKIDPGMPQEIDPGLLSEEQRSLLNISRLPTTFGEALDALENDQVLMDALGPVLGPTYLAVKRSELAFLQDKTQEEIAHQYFCRF